MLRDNEVTPRQLACRQANAKICHAYNSVVKMNAHFNTKASDAEVVAYRDAWQSVFDIIEETNKSLSS